MTPASGNGTTPATPSAERKSSPARARPGRARFFRAVKHVTLALAGVILLFAVYYYFYSVRQQGYLSGRNLRALSSVSTQIGTALQSADQILKLIDTKVDTGLAELDSASPFIPLYNDVVVGLGEREFVGDQAGQCQALRKQRPSRKPASEAVSLAGWERDPAWLPYCFYQRITLSDSTRRKVANTDSALVIINMAEYLGPILPRGVFHKTLLADDAGRVVLQAGLPEVAVMDLKALVPKGKGDTAAGQWADLKLKPSITEVRLAGKPYRLFMQPCCLTSDGAYRDRDFVVAGLVTKDALIRESLKVSVSIVTLCSIILFLVFLGWPFLKLRLIGEREPVLTRDGLLLAGCSLMAVAVSTIFLLDLYSYTKFREDRDEDLGALSAEIIAHLRQEVADAYHQLDTLVASEGSQAGPGPPVDSMMRIRKDGLAFRFFESWSLVDSNGMQVRKWSTDAYVQPRIPVKDRTYFKNVAQGLGWPGPPSATSLLPSQDGFGLGRPYYLEPTVSRTTGKRQVALSLDAGNAITPVATMALDMISLIGVVLPPGYGFAVVDSSGRVLLHSDASRNLDELFFSESDHNRKLISAVTARTVDTLNLKYGGADFRAHVAPVPAMPWTLITVLDKQPGRITNAEWLGTSVFLTLIYALLVGNFTVLTLLFIRGYRAPWIWPDRRLRGAYLRLAGVSCLFLGAMLVAMQSLEGDDLLLTSFVLPIQAMTAAWACLAIHPTLGRAWSLAIRASGALVLYLVLLPNLLASHTTEVSRHAVVLLALVASIIALLPRGWLRPQPDPAKRKKARSIEWPYLAAVTLLMVVTGVMPAAAFFQIARSAHTGMLVKHGQLRLAHAMQERQNRIVHAYDDDLGGGKTAAREDRLISELDLYYQFYFGTRLNPETSPTADSAPASPVSLKWVRQFLVPYRPPSSVEWRNMLPGSASDSAWSWTIRNGSLEFRGSGPSGAVPVSMSSVLPRFWPERTPDRWSAVLLGISVLVLTVGIARFLARRFFLIDVTDPVLIPGSQTIASLGSTNLLVVCGKGFDQNTVQPRGGGILDLSTDKFAPRRARNDLLNGVARNEPVVVKHFEYGRKDAGLTRAKLDLLDALVAESGSSLVVLAEQGPDGEPLGLREARLVATPPDTTAESNQHQGASGFGQLLDSLVVVNVRRWERGWRSDDRRRSPRAQAGSHDVSWFDRRGAAIWWKRLKEAIARWTAAVPSTTPAMPYAESGFELHLGSWTELQEATAPMRQAIARWKADRPSLANHIIDTESRSDPHLETVWKGLKEAIAGQPTHRAEPSREELLDLLGDRAEPYYQRLWESCQTGERVVLVHLAQHGLVNDKDRRILRRLLTRGLICRKPNFAIMNETFRRFLLARAAEVQADVPSGSQSTWDTVRRPVLGVVAAVALLLFLTQQELFSATNAIITAMATGVASFGKLSGLFDRRPTSGSGT